MLICKKEWGGKEFQFPFQIRYWPSLAQQREYWCRFQLFPFPCRLAGIFKRSGGKLLHVYRVRKALSPIARPTCGFCHWRSNGPTGWRFWSDSAITFVLHPKCKVCDLYGRGHGQTKSGTSTRGCRGDRQYCGNNPHRDCAGCWSPSSLRRLTFGRHRQSAIAPLYNCGCTWRNTNPGAWNHQHQWLYLA